MSWTHPPSTEPNRIHSVPGQIAKLRSQGWPDQRTRPRDGGKVMTEDDPAMRRHEVAAVIEALGRSRTGGVHRQDPGGDPGGVEPVADDVNADAGRDQPQRVDGLIAVGGDAANGKGADNRENYADYSFKHLKSPPRHFSGGIMGLTVSVAVVVRLIGTLDRNADIGRLLAR